LNLESAGEVDDTGVRDINDGEVPFSGANVAGDSEGGCFCGCRHSSQIDARARLDVVSLRQADVDITSRGVLPCDGEWLACDDVETAVRHVDVVGLGLRESDGRQQGEDQSEESHRDELLDVCVLTNVFCGSV